MIIFNHIYSVCKFTFHYVSIKSHFVNRVISRKKAFTFHYVSIKSKRPPRWESWRTNLHSTMYLLNRRSHKRRAPGYQDLHSTMYLLNPVPQHLIISQAYFVLFCRPTIIQGNKICIHQKPSLFTA